MVSSVIFRSTGANAEVVVFLMVMYFVIPMFSIVLCDLMDISITTGVIHCECVGNGYM